MWSFAGILFLAVFTGAAVSAFSSAESNGQVTPLEDLANFRTGIYTGAATERESRKISAPMPPHVANLPWVFRERLFPSIPPEHGLERVLVDGDHSPRNLLDPRNVAFYQPAALQLLAAKHCPSGIFGLLEHLRRGRSVTAVETLSTCWPRGALDQQKTSSTSFGRHGWAYGDLPARMVPGQVWDLHHRPVARS